MSRPETPALSAIAGLSELVVKQPAALDASFASTQGCVEVLTADLAGVLISDHGSGLRILACSREDDESLDLLQAQSKHESATRIIRSNEATFTFHVDAQDGDSDFDRKVRAAGYVTVVIAPLLARNERIGVLTVFWQKAPEITVDHILTLETFANLTSAALLSEHVVADERVLATLLESTFQDRIALEQAKGMVAQAMDCSIEKAFDWLEQYAKLNTTSLRIVAQGVLNRSIKTQSLTSQ